jgi:RNA polymerase sigma-70 factor (ECF subfamily)
LAHVPYTDAEDLMQTVFMHAMQRLPALRDAEAFGGWLAAIARNLAFDYYRQRRNLVELDVQRNDKLDRSHSSRSDSYEAGAALDAIRRLPEAYRETLMLRLVEGMTGPEIAARTGLTPDSVRVNLCRGLKLLRGQLGGDRE